MPRKPTIVKLSQAQSIAVFGYNIVCSLTKEFSVFDTILPVEVIENTGNRLTGIFQMNALVQLALNKEPVADIYLTGFYDSAAKRQHLTNWQITKVAIYKPKPRTFVYMVEPHRSNIGSPLSAKNYWLELVK